MKKTESPLLFNWEDMEQKANAYLDQVRQQGRTILEKAVAEANAACEKIFEEAEEKRRQAEKDGFEQGFEKGYTEGAAKREEELSRIVQEEVRNELQASGEKYRHLLDALKNSRAEILEIWEKGFLTLVCSVAQAVIRREVANDPNIERHWIREMLERCAGESELRLRLHPDDVAKLENALQVLHSEFRGLGKIDLRKDATLEPGDCVLETEFGTLDQRVFSQLGRIVEELNL
ncbi:MAG: FliH/SctL family protein [Planctomycetia bacterium]|nr:FliH/SctL family protein [Planctomycetia bacterium]